MERLCPKDLWLALRVRQSVLADGALSTHAQQLRIAALNGTVGLSGVLRTAHDKRVVAFAY